MSWFSELIDRWRRRPVAPVPPVVPPTPTPTPGPVDASASEKALLAAGRTFKHKTANGETLIGVRSILEGETHAAVMKEARAYAAHMASINRQDRHAGFNERAARIRKVLPGLSPSEITAESGLGGRVCGHEG